VRCPACGARNPDGSAWCTQCFAATDPSTAPAAGPVMALGTPPAATTPPAPQTAPVTVDASSRDLGASSAAPSAATRDIRQRDEVVEWRCGRCDDWTVLERGTCHTCGATRAGFGASASPRTTRALEPATALGVSLVVPGAAHLLTGRVGSGIARALLGLGWLLVALLTWGSSAGTPPVVALVFLTGAATVYGATLVDAWQLGRPANRELLRPRVLTVLVVTVTVVAVLAMAVSALG
jgi:TM2 domain-containing membrane protein YozV